ncbi:unnamed protein product, partial [Mesorhabditis belari]|uniref:Uncharacterized protein n=1 Tax=Mesorhabditis belari TaxID=2138241 RepID=A0AAF3EYK9_9BILA
MTTNREECSCRKKLVLPPILPWESGSNKFASQKGESPFGATRNNVLSLDPPKPNSDPPPFVDNRPIPIFGGPRPHLTSTVIKMLSVFDVLNLLHFKNNEKTSTKRHNFSPTPSDSINVEKTFRTQNLKIESTRLRTLNEEEELLCKAAIPRFVSPSSSIAEKHEKELKENHTRHRSTWNGDYSVIGSEERQRYLAWIGGQLTTVRPIGQPNPSKNQTYYERLMFERDQQVRPEVLSAKLEAYANPLNS